MVLTVSFALSPVTGLSCHRRPRDHHLASLTSASGCQDHTTSPSAFAPPVLRRQSVHRIPHPTFVTIAKRPSWWGGTARENASDLGLRSIPTGCDRLARRANQFWRG